MLFSCQKKTKNVNNQIANIVNIFPLGPNNFWKAYYHAPYGGPGVYERGVDSFYVSTDTVGLYTISNNNNIIDTNWVVYNIIKVKRTRKNFNDLQIYTGTEKKLRHRKGRHSNAAGIYRCACVLMLDCACSGAQLFLL